MNPSQFKKLFPLGSHLCREPMPPMAELKKDMENLKKHGFNLVKLQEHWQIDEPEEGKYDFSRYEELIEHAAKLDLGVYLGLTCEQAPNWLWDKHPDCRMVGRNGLPIAYQAQTTLPGDGKPGPCYDHPGAMEDMKRFIRQLVKTLGQYENIVVWNTWQEIAYWADGFAGQHVCYCENTLNHFRKWLKERHGDLDALNKAWNTRYAEWKQVLPERCNRKMAVAQEIEWRYFMDNIQIGMVLRARAQAIRAADHMKRPIFAHKGGLFYGSGQDWQYARSQDFMGISCYPSSFWPWDDKYCQKEDAVHRQMTLLAEAWCVQLMFDYLRSCNPPGTPIWSAEFMGGPGANAIVKSRVPTGDDLRRWMFSAIGSGATGISFWVTRAEIMAPEANGFGLLDSEGDSTPRFEEASRVGRALNQHADLFGRATGPAAPVGIVVSEWNHQFFQTLPEGDSHLQHGVRGWHRMLWDSDIPTGFLEINEWNEDKVCPFRVLVLPCALFLSELAAAKLIRFVHNGGVLISDAAPGRINENGFCNRGEMSPSLRELFGVRHQNISMVGEPENGSRWSRQEAPWGQYLAPAMLSGVNRLQGRALRANVYVQTFVPLQSEPCLLYGEAVAGTFRQAGKGAAWLLGTWAGHQGLSYRDSQSPLLIQAILAQCGVKPEHNGKLLLRKRKNKDKEAWIFTNKGNRDIIEEIDVKGWKKIDDLLEGPLNVKSGRVKIKVKSLDVKVLIVSR